MPAPKTKLEKLEARLAAEQDPDMQKILQGKVDALKGIESADTGDIDWLEVTEDDLKQVKGKRIAGDFPAEFGVGYELSEKSIAVPFTMLPSAPFQAESNYLFPRSSGGAFKVKEFDIMGVPYKVHPQTGQIGLKFFADDDGVKRYPDFAGKQANITFAQRKVREGSAEAAESPDGYRGFYGNDGTWYRSLDPVAILPLKSKTEEVGV